MPGVDVSLPYEPGHASISLMLDSGLDVLLGDDFVSGLREVRCVGSKFSPGRLANESVFRVVD